MGDSDFPQKWVDWLGVVLKKGVYPYVTYFHPN